jgi:hypothetical protein
MKHTDFNSILADLRGRSDCFDVLFDEHGTYVHDAERLHEEARRALAREALWLACRAYDRKALESEPVEELEAFAFDTYRGAGELPESRGLRARRRIGPRWSHRLQYVRPSSYVHRARKVLRDRQLHMNGV